MKCGNKFTDLERKFNKSVRIYLIGLNEPFWNESCKGVNLFEIGFQMVDVWDIYLIKIFLKINNLGNYL